ncbi:MAG: hypothetical protein QW035_04630 [Candidatus Anstonellales archaeon]
MVQALNKEEKKALDEQKPKIPEPKKAEQGKPSAPKNPDIGEKKEKEPDKEPIVKKVLGTKGQVGPNEHTQTQEIDNKKTENKEMKKMEEMKKEQEKKQQKQIEELYERAKKQLELCRETIKNEAEREKAKNRKPQEEKEEERKKGRREEKNDEKKKEGKEAEEGKTKEQKNVVSPENEKQKPQELQELLKLMDDHIKKYPPSQEKISEMLKALDLEYLTKEVFSDIYKNHNKSAPKYIEEQLDKLADMLKKLELTPLTFQENEPPNANLEMQKPPEEGAAPSQQVSATPSIPSTASAKVELQLDEKDIKNILECFGDDLNNFANKWNEIVNQLNQLKDKDPDLLKQAGINPEELKEIPLDMVASIVADVEKVLGKEEHKDDAEKIESLLKLLEKFQDLKLDDKREIIEKIENSDFDEVFKLNNREKEAFERISYIPDAISIGIVSNVANVAQKLAMEEFYKEADNKVPKPRGPVVKNG